MKDKIFFPILGLLYCFLIAGIVLFGNTVVRFLIIFLTNFLPAG